MPKVTDITFQTKNKSRCNIFVDGEFFSGVSLETVLKFRIKKGDEYNSEELKNLIRTTPFTKIGIMYGVSDNAVRKWCDAYNLPRTKTDIKQYNDIEWANI